MIDNKSKFGTNVKYLNFVSNQPCNFIDSSKYPCSLSEAPSTVKKSILASLATEVPGIKESDLGMIFYVTSDFSLESYEDALLGKVVNFIESECGIQECNHKGFYLSLVDQCRSRSKTLADTADLKSLLAAKFVTRDQMSDWLAALVRRTAHRPQWSEVAGQLSSMPAMQLASWRKGWDRYHVDRVARTDLAFARLREATRSILDSVPQIDPRPLSELVTDILPQLQTQLASLNTPEDRPYLIGALLYEIWCDD